ncbi:Protein of unknown function, partial [Cotesia congregata]
FDVYVRTAKKLEQKNLFPLILIKTQYLFAQKLLQDMTQLLPVEYNRSNLEERDNMRTHL